MRNLLQYPITTDEIIGLLRKYLREHRAGINPGDPPVGDMTPLLLEEAIWRLQDNWYVSRQGDDGNPVMIQEGMSEPDARALFDLLTERGHKQVYLLRRKRDGMDENFLNKPIKAPK